MKLKSPTVSSSALLVLASVFAFAIQADAVQLPNPTITASARPFAAAYTAANLFDNGNADGEYATATQGAVSAPFTTSVTDGTWVQFDFGTTVTFDRFVMASRQNAADIIGTSRLIVSSDPIFDNSDTIFTFNPSGFNGAGIVRNLGSVSGRYVRWEVLTSTGSSQNLGAKQMWFLNTPGGNVLLPAPTAINSSTPFNANFVASQAVNGDAGYSPTSEYASQGAGANMFIDFDFGVAVPVSGFDFWNRIIDHVTTFNLVFANSSDFSSPVATLPFTADSNGNQVNSATFAPVTARYVRLQATGAAGGLNTGMREIQFYTPTGQAPLITQQPRGGTRLIGDTFTFSLGAGGDNPLTFQWWKDTSRVEGATSSSLTLSNLQVSDSGSYTVVVSNPYGTLTSSPAALSVINPPVDFTSDLRAWYTLDEQVFLSAADSSGNGNDGTLQGFVDDDSQWVAARINGGLQFNPAGSGVDEVVVIPGAAGQLDFSANAEFTLSAWVRGPAGQEDGAAVIAKGTGGGGEQYAVDIYGGAYRFFVRDASGAAGVVSGNIGPNGTWQHVVAVYSRTLNRMKLYVNTSEVGSANPFAGQILANQHDISLGARKLSTTDYNLNLNGVLDDVRVYARPLTPSDIAALYYDAPPMGPTIVRQPQPVYAAVGGSAALSVIVDGTVPFSYQWFKGVNVIPDATNATFTITAAQPSDDSEYEVTVSNPWGNTYSTPAHVTVISFLNLSTAPVQASSIFSPDYVPAGAFDGLRLSTGPNNARWASAPSGAPHWMYVDLGQEMQIRRVTVDWDPACGRDHTLRVRTAAQGPSSNPDDWRTVASVVGYAQAGQGVDGPDLLYDFIWPQIVAPGNTSPTMDSSIFESPIVGRYLMLHTTAIAPGFAHVSVWEMQVDAISVQPRVQSLAVDGSGATVIFQGIPSLNYQVLRASDVTGPWTSITTIAPAASGTAHYTDPAPPQGAGFYQIAYP